MFSKHRFLLLSLVWLIINLVQAAFCELSFDEAYYWMYANFLDFGYYDHPPMVALMIKLGSSIASGELGVRIITNFFGFINLWVLREILERKGELLLLLIFGSITSFHIYSFISVPDSPLLLGCSLVLLTYKTFLKKDDFLHSMLLAAAIAFMLYSKYHGFLVLVILLIANPRVILKRSFFIVFIISTVLYLPHILWQIDNDYPSYTFHILQKSLSPYSPLDSLEALLGLLIIIGPIIGWLLIYFVFKFKPQNGFDRTLKFIAIGIPTFFLISTLNSRIEINWMVVSVVPITLIAVSYLNRYDTKRKLTRSLAVVSLFLFLIARIFIGLDFTGELMGKDWQFSGWKSWAKKVKDESEGLPIVFMNSYQQASIYNFYNDDNSMSWNNVWYRRNQYDLWPIDDSLRGKRVMMLFNYDDPGAKIVETDKGDFRMVKIDDFQSLTKVSIRTGLSNINLKSDSTVELIIFNGYKEKLNFSGNHNFRLVATYYEQEKVVKEETLQDLNGRQIQDTLKLSVILSEPKRVGNYYVRFSIKVDELPAPINSNLIPLKF